MNDDQRWEAYTGQRDSGDGRISRRQARRFWKKKRRRCARARVPGPVPVTIEPEPPF